MNRKIGSLQEIFKALLRYLASTPAELLLINIEDLWQETLAQNIPSSGFQYKNWRHRMKKSLEEVFQDKALASFLEDLRPGERREA